MPTSQLLLALPADILPVLIGLFGAWLHVAFPPAHGLPEEAALLAAAGAP